MEVLPKVPHFSYKINPELFTFDIPMKRIVCELSELEGTIKRQGKRMNGFERLRTEEDYHGMLLTTKKNNAIAWRIRSIYAKIGLILWEERQMAWEQFDENPYNEIMFWELVPHPEELARLPNLDGWVIHALNT